MRKIVLICLIVSGIFADNQSVENIDSASVKSGGIFGAAIGGGLAYSYSCAGMCFNGSGSYTESSNQFTIGLKGGYQHFFNPYFGIRGYGDFYYSMPTDTSSTSGNINVSALKTNFMMISANADVMAGFAFGKNDNHSLGALAGLGGGYISYENNRMVKEKQNKFGVNVNFGFYYGYKNHLVEIIAKFLPSIDKRLKAVESSGGANATNAYSWNFVNLIGLIGYTYTF